MISFVFITLIHSSFSCSIENCEFCSAKDFRICLNCSPGYSRDSLEGCTALSGPNPHNWRIENCLELKNNSCIKCLDGYSLESGRCEPVCEYEGCICFSPSTCLHSVRSLACTEGYGLDSNGYCTSCKDNNCKDCNDNYKICIICYEGYGKKIDDGNCINCADEFCEDCNDDYEGCIICEEGFGLKTNTNETFCHQCIDRYCNNCNDNYEICTTCVEGYGLDSDDYCYICNTENCKNCNDDFTICTSCYEGYGLNSNYGNCTYCIDDNCNHCDYDYEVCIACYEGYRLESNGYCTNCADWNCKDCNDDYRNCITCSSGYGKKLVDDNCTRCTDDRCENCNYNYENCTQCFENYGLSLNESALGALMIIAIYVIMIIKFVILAIEVIN